MSNINIVRPLRDEVLTRIVEQERMVGGIVVPDNAEGEDKRIGVVLSLGPRCTGIVKRGDQVLLPKHVSASVTIKDQNKYALVREDEILAVMEE